MKYILMLAATFIFTACNSASKHDHHGEHHDHAAMEGHQCSGSCEMNKDGAKPACGAEAKDKDGKHVCSKECKKSCNKDCKHKEKGDRQGCSEKSCSSKDAAAGAACTAGAEAKDNLTSAASKEELSKILTDNKDKLGKDCSAAASAYCGKVSRDMMINETELNCLWSKVFRVTRETLPKLDGTNCAKMIKTFAKKTTTPATTAH